MGLSIFYCLLKFSLKHLRHLKHVVKVVSNFLRFLNMKNIRAHPRMALCKQNSECFLNLQENKSYDLSFFKNMELFLECALVSLPGATNRCEFTLDYSSELAIVFFICFITIILIFLFPGNISINQCSLEFTEIHLVYRVNSRVLGLKS